MGISLPPITSRRFPLYWVMIASVSLVFFTILSRLIPSGGISAFIIIMIHPFCLIAIPLILLKTYLKSKQQVIWISSQYASQLVLMIAAFGIFPLNLKSSEPTIKISFATIYNPGTYNFLAIVVIIWIIASFIQIWNIPFKHPKRWLICNVLTFGVTLIFVCWPHESTSREVSLLGDAVRVFVYGFLMPGLTGLGLYFSGMGLRKQRDDRDLRLE